VAANTGYFKGEINMSKPSKTVVLALLALAAVGCAGTQKGTQVAEHGSARTDAQRGSQVSQDEAPAPAYWQKMR
jgi:type IV pilus biogenesis protein CpaD/CtpE